MSKAKKTSPSLINQTNVIILAGLLVAALGYFGYRSLLTNPDINVIGAGEGAGNSYNFPKDTIKVSREKTIETRLKRKETTNSNNNGDDKNDNPGKSQTGGGAGFGPNNKAVDQR